MLVAPDRKAVNHLEKRKALSLIVPHFLYLVDVIWFSWCSSVYCPFSNPLWVRKLWKFVRLKHRATKKCEGAHGAENSPIPLASSVLNLRLNLPGGHAKSLQFCPTPCDPMDCSLPGSSVHGIFQPRILEWVAISFSLPMDHTQLRGRTHVPASLALVGEFLTTEPPWMPLSEH